MAKINSLNKFHPTYGQSFFFDTNVWIILFSPIAGSKPKLQTLYGNLLNDIEKTNSSVFISSMVLSEYINRSIRLSHEIWKENQEKTGNFKTDFKKDYRPTQDYLDAQQDAYDEAREIMKKALPRSDDFHVMADKLDSIMSEKGMDFNDAYFAALCEKNNLILVSDDRDLQNTKCNITLVTP